MKWKQPPRIKFYEAIGALGDDRVKLNGSKARVKSSVGNKFYDVTYDEKTHTIASNDNGSYWQKYLGYPALSYLLAAGIVERNHTFEKALAGIPWKDINLQNKYDYAQTESYVRDIAQKRGCNLEKLDEYIDQCAIKVRDLDLNILTPLPKPPEGDAHA